MISQYYSHLWQVYGHIGALGEPAAWAAAVDFKIAPALVAARNAVWESA